MVWTPETSCGHEAAKIAAHTVRYLQGRFLDLGAGNSPVWPSAIAIDNQQTFANNAGIRSDVRDLSMFADGSIDGVFSSHVLEDFEPSKAPSILAEWWRVIKDGGHLVLYLPHPDFYPHIGEPGCNPAHKWEPTPDAVIALMKGVGNWTLLENEVRGGTNEYSFFMVFRKEPLKEARTFEHKFDVWQRNPEGRKRALVVRFGAIGDMIVASSIFPLLKKQGYHVTVMCKLDSADIIRHDPHVDDIIAQEDDYVPNRELGPYIESLRERYDNIINLCESIEGALLTLPGRIPNTYSDEVRRKLFGNINYCQQTHRIAGVSDSPKDMNPKFYPTSYERKWAKAVRKAMADDAPVISWAIAGSSIHKIWPYVPGVVQYLMENTRCHVVLLGDGQTGLALQEGLMQPLKEAGVDLSRVHGMCGKWSVRESLVFVQHSDLVIGPETGLLNCVSHEPDVAKIIYLSHSSRNNLTKFWPNTITLEPDRKMAPCYPCHRLHPDFTTCPRDEKTHAALCAAAVSAEMVVEAIGKVLVKEDLGEKTRKDG